MAITLRTGVVDEGKSRLLFQFRKSDGDFPTFFEPMLNQCQILENVFYALIAGRQLATATGWALDMIGADVGQTRTLNQSDDEYRGLIYARIAINTSSGRNYDLYNITRLCGATTAQIVDVYPAAVQVNYTGTIAITGAQLRTALESASPPIEIGIVESPETGYFSLAGDPNGLGLGLGALSTAY